jgi:nitrate reductase NapD
MKPGTCLASPAQSPEIHIAGVLVHCRPPSIVSLHHAVQALPGAEIFQSSDEGKLVVVIEASSAKSVLDTIDAIRVLPGVLNAALVYQHAEPAASLSEEIGA